MEMDGASTMPADRQILNCERLAAEVCQLELDQVANRGHSLITALAACPDILEILSKS